MNGPCSEWSWIASQHQYGFNRNVFIYLSRTSFEAMLNKKSTLFAIVAVHGPYNNIHSKIMGNKLMKISDWENVFGPFPAPPTFKGKALGTRLRSNVWQYPADIPPNINLACSQISSTWDTKESSTNLSASDSCRDFTLTFHNDFLFPMYNVRSLNLIVNCLQEIYFLLPAIHIQISMLIQPSSRNNFELKGNLIASYLQGTCSATNYNCTTSMKSATIPVQRPNQFRTQQ